MKQTTIFLVFIATILTASAFPRMEVQELPENAELEMNDGMDVNQLPETPIVQPRITCDVLSATGVNHAACALHCLLKGHSGGYCNNKKVCICR